MNYEDLDPEMQAHIDAARDPAVIEGRLDDEREVTN